ncbi:hypothetical protein MAM1_0396c10294 [Mucor ambiguus]|uniref:Uncharacterized protein n=1 Tax=Mucor ambiguus TaxID=91626 RepID=A0A0C9N3V3_9FUNG|nr:hypothetical protein MAM1_0396c10294 [Mucor ambiguus]
MSGKLRQVNDARVDSVANNILSWEDSLETYSTVNSQYPSDGVLVFMLYATGSALMLTAGRLSAGTQPCGAVWYFVLVSGTFIAIDALIVDSSTARFAGKLLVFRYSFGQTLVKVEILPVKL